MMMIIVIAVVVIVVVVVVDVACLLFGTLWSMSLRPLLQGMCYDSGWTQRCKG
jgi:hypothetical protein